MESEKIDTNITKIVQYICGSKYRYKLLRMWKRYCFNIDLKIREMLILCE